MASPFLNTELENALARSNCWMDQEHPLVCSPSLPLFFHSCSVLPCIAVVTFFSLRGCLVSNTSSHHSLPSSFNFLTLYFNMLSPRDYEGQRVRPCHRSYDTLIPIQGHCMSISLWLYLFILSSRFREKVSSLATPKTMFYVDGGRASPHLTVARCPRLPIQTSAC